MIHRISLEQPEIFKAAAVERHGIVYAETRRTDESSMAGNLSEQEYWGDIPLVISQKNYERSGSGLSFEEWAEDVRAKAHILGHTLESYLGLRAIGFPSPVHGTDLINLDDEMDSVRIDVAFPARPTADATLVTKNGYGTSFTPADCAVSNVVDVKTGAIMQIHTGYVGLGKGTIASALNAARDYVDPAHSLVYVSPHAQAGYVINQVNNVLYDRFMADPFLKDFVAMDADGQATLSLREPTHARLVEAGFKEENIQISTDNTLTDETLFSQSNFLTHGVNGRSGMILAKRDVR